MSLTASGYDGSLVKYTFADWATLIISIPSLVGLYVFAYKKQFSTTQFWKVILWITIFLDAYTFAYYSLPAKSFLPEFLRFSTTLSGLEAIIVLIFDFPILYTAYQLAYNPHWYKREDKKFSISIISKEKTGWWKTSAIAIFLFSIFAFINLLSPVNEVQVSVEGQTVLAIISFIAIAVGILLWYRINLALYFSLVFFAFRSVSLLVGKEFIEFSLNAIFFFVLFITALKTQTNISKS